jgi:hypothetical protein
MSETTLWTAVLELALMDFFRVRFSNSTTGDNRDIHSWFESSSREIGSFHFCCDVLGLSASAIRRELVTGDPVVLRRRLRSNPTPTRAAAIGLYDPAFGITEGRRIGESHLRPMM